jgi:hypothetical protein
VIVGDQNLQHSATIRSGSGHQPSLAPQTYRGTSG